MEARRRENEIRIKQIDQYRDSEFETWLMKLSEDQKISMVPPQGVAKLGSFGHKQLLKNYFNETVWPEFKHAILGAPELDN